MRFYAKARTSAATSSSPITSSVALRSLAKGDTEGCLSRGTYNRIARILTFAECPDILRGSRLTTLMRCGAAIYKGSKGSEATYALSEEVEAIDFFISHNWSVPRFHKFLAMVVYFNFTIAVTVTAVVACTLVVLGAFGLLPLTRCFDGFRFCCVARTVLVPVFMLTLFFCRDAMHSLGHRGAVVFLDKTCIDQVDLDRQKVGILKLGAFEFKSKTFVILYTDAYLTKVWTVYEVAAFLCVHSTMAMTVLPTAKARCMCAGVFPFYIFSHAGLVSTAMFGQSSFIRIDVPLGFCLAFSQIFASRIWQRETDKITNRVSNFTIRDCACFHEPDRDLVYENVCLLMKFANSGAPDGTMGSEGSQIAPDSTQEDVLQAFDCLVRSKVLGVVHASLGLNLFTHGQYICLGATFAGACAVDMVAQYGQDAVTKAYFWNTLVLLLTWMIGVWPILSMVCEALSRRFVGLSGCLQIGYVFAAAAFTSAGAAAVFYLHLGLVSFSESGRHPNATAALVALCPILAWLACRLAARSTSRGMSCCGCGSGAARAADDAPSPVPGNDEPQCVATMTPVLGNDEPTPSPVLGNDACTGSTCPGPQRDGVTSAETKGSSGWEAQDASLEPPVLCRAKV